MAKIDFFLSFNRADRTTADLVYQTVSGAGFSCFYQHQDIPEGANFVQRMSSGLNEAATMLALFSPAYFQSRYALAELHAAFADDPLNERGSILPLLIKEYHIPKPFNFLTFVDGRDLGEADLRAKLGTALAQYRIAHPDQVEAVIPETNTAAAAPELLDDLEVRIAHPDQVDSVIPETNTAAAARKLLDDLEVAYLIFQSQCEVRDALVDAMCERDPKLDLVEYEPFIARYYAQMTRDERALHQRIREHTDTIEKLNRHALYCVEASKDFRRRIPRMERLREHLEAWLDKYDRTFEIDPSVGVLYVGVEEAKPFPTGIEAEILQYIGEKRSGSAPTS